MVSIFKNPSLFGQMVEKLLDFFWVVELTTLLATSVVICSEPKTTDSIDLDCVECNV